jgi:hypothetical protein
MKLMTITSLGFGILIIIPVFSAFAMTIGIKNNINVTNEAMPVLDFITLCLISILYFFIPLGFYKLGLHNNKV